MPLYSSKTLIRGKKCIIYENKELLKKLNSFEEKGIKHFRSAILQTKTIAVIDQNA